MTNKLHYFLFLFFLLWSACTKEEPIEREEHNSGPSVLYASFESVHTKVAFGPTGATKQVSWREGDKIVLMEVNASATQFTGKNYRYTLSSGSGTARASFAADADVIANGNSYIPFFTGSKTMISSSQLPVAGSSVYTFLMPIAMSQLSNGNESHIENNFMMMGSTLLVANSSTQQTINFVNKCSVWEVTLNCNNSGWNIPGVGSNPTFVGAQLFIKDPAVSCFAQTVSFQPNASSMLTMGSNTSYSRSIYLDLTDAPKASLLNNYKVRFIFLLNGPTRIAPVATFSLFTSNSRITSVTKTIGSGVSLQPGNYYTSSVTFSSQPVPAAVWHGSPPPIVNGCYELSLPDHFAWIAANNDDNDGFPNTTFRVLSDIDFDNQAIVSIGTAQVPFKGTFMGNGGTTKYISDMMVYGKGLFGYTSGATIKNISVSGKVNDRIYNDDNTYVQGNGNTLGGIVGKARDTRFHYCSSSVQLVSSGDTVGSVVGYAEGGSLSYCVNNGGVRGRHVVGGIVGYSKDCVISNVSSLQGLVKGLGGDDEEDGVQGNYIGGIVGVAEMSSGGYLVKLATNEGDVEGGSHVGGIVGYCKGRGVIYRCYNNGTIKSFTKNRVAGGLGYAGGIAGYVESTLITGCYFAPRTTGVVVESNEGVAGGVLGYLSTNSCVWACYVNSATKRMVTGGKAYRDDDEYYNEPICGDRYAETMADGTPTIGNCYFTSLTKSRYPLHSGQEIVNEFSTQLPSTRNRPQASLSGWGLSMPPGWSSGVDFSGGQLWYCPWSSVTLSTTGRWDGYSYPGWVTPIQTPLLPPAL